MQGLKELNKWFRIMAVVELLVFGFELIYHHLHLVYETMIDLHNHPSNTNMPINDFSNVWIPSTAIYGCLVAAGVFVLASLVTTIVIMIKEKKNQKSN